MHASVAPPTSPPPPTSRGIYGLEWAGSFGCGVLYCLMTKADIARTLLRGRQCDGSCDAVTPLLHARHAVEHGHIYYTCLNDNRSALEEGI